MQIWSAEIKELESSYASIKGRFPELEKELEKLIKADDENMILLLSQGEKNKSEIYLAKYKPIRKETSMDSDSELNSGIGNIYEQTGNFEKAEEYYSKSLELEPQNSNEQIVIKKAWDLLPDYDHNIFLHFQEAENAITR
jgi:tetratricopeptide (TPR) repeat protein